MLLSIKKYLFSWVYGAYNAEPYATHLPILILLSKIYPPTRVLELGSGLVSTPAFLNRKVFEKLDLLVSVENDREWFERIKSEIPHDSRLNLVYTDLLMKEYIRKTDIVDYQWIFIDDSQNTPDRVGTIMEGASGFVGGLFSIQS